MPMGQTLLVSCEETGSRRHLAISSQLAPIDLFAGALAENTRYDQGHSRRSLRSRDPTRLAVFRQDNEVVVARGEPSHAFVPHPTSRFVAGSVLR